jgi:hypothetical protein
MAKVKGFFSRRSQTMDKDIAKNVAETDAQKNKGYQVSLDLESPKDKQRGFDIKTPLSSIFNFRHRSVGLGPKSPLETQVV